MGAQKSYFFDASSSAAIAYRAGPEHVVIARFDHPKFPSDTKRWEAWVDFLDARNCYLCPCHNSTFALDGFTARAAESKPD